MNGHDRRRARRDGCRYGVRIDKAILAHVCKDRCGAGAHDRGSRGDEGIGWRDDLVAGLHTRGNEPEDQCIGAGIERHRMLGADVVGDFALERLDLRPADMHPGHQCGFDPRHQFGFFLRKLGAKIDVGDLPRGHAASPLVESRDRFGDELELARLQILVHGNRDCAGGMTIRYRKASRLIAEMAQSRLAIERDGIMNLAFDLVRVAARQQFITPLDEYLVRDIAVRRPGISRRNSDLRN